MISKYKDYTILYADTTGDLIRQVNLKLSEGYVPIGSLQVVVSEYSNGYLENSAKYYKYYQAIAKPID